MDALWPLIPVTMLSLRQFTGGRTARLALFLAMLPALFAVLFAARPWGVLPDEFLSELFRELMLPTLLPIVVLLPATAAFGDELEDDTLPYLLMKPVTRLRLVCGKYAAVLLVTIPTLIVGLALTTVIATRAPGEADAGRLLLAMSGSAAAAAILLGAVFLLISLVAPRALLVGMVYIFAWESLLGRFLPGVRAISSREQAVRVFDGLLADDMAVVADAVKPMAAVAIVALLIAVWRLRQIQID
jgi:ABC-2 type transport system permease protein